MRAQLFDVCVVRLEEVRCSREGDGECEAGPPGLKEDVARPCHTSMRAEIMRELRRMALDACEIMAKMKRWLVVGHACFWPPNVHIFSRRSGRRAP